MKRINEEFWNPFGPKCHRTDDLSFCPEPFYLNYKTWTLLASFIAIAPGVSLLSGNVLKNKPLKPFMTFIMHSSRFPNYWLGRMDCDRNDTSLTATITDAVQNLIWNINLAESYIYIVFWKLILSYLQFPNVFSISYCTLPEERPMFHRATNRSIFEVT